MNYWKLISIFSENESLVKEKEQKCSIIWEILARTSLHFSIHYNIRRKKERKMKGRSVGERGKTLSKRSVRTKSGKNANRNESHDRKRGNPEKR